MPVVSRLVHEGVETVNPIPLFEEKKFRSGSFSQHFSVNRPGSSRGFK